MPKHSTITVYGCLSEQNIENIDVMNLLNGNKTINTFMLPQWIKTKYQVALLPIFYKVRKTIT